MTIKFDPRNFWIGLQWASKTLAHKGRLRSVEATFCLCLIPMFPITWKRTYLKS